MKTLALILSLMAFAGLAQAETVVHQRGTKILDGRGRELNLRGVNLGGWFVWEGWIFGNGILHTESTMLARLQKQIGKGETDAFEQQVYEHFITEADIQRISAAGFNCVRVPLHHRLFDSPRGFELLDHLMDWCEKHRVYVVLDLHAAPGGQSGLFMADPAEPRDRLWVSRESQDKTVDLWRKIAGRYGKRKYLAGYDLLNEPAPPSGEALAALYQRIIEAIRAVDADHMIILEGAKFSTDFSMFDKPPCKNLAMSFHMYTWFGDDRAKKIGEYVDLARRLDVPLWCGEFGENTVEMIRSTVDLYAVEPVINGWVYWTWKKAPNHFPGTLVVKMDPNWKAVIDWLSSPLGLNPPDAATIRAGMKAFIEAIDASKCEENAKMIRAVLPGH